jgi:hypothetical protein
MPPFERELHLTRRPATIAVAAEDRVPAAIVVHSGRLEQVVMETIAPAGVDVEEAEVTLLSEFARKINQKE